MKDKLILKVQNLLELAYDSPSDEEGQTALLLAQKLMVKHKLSLSDIEAVQKKEGMEESIAAESGRMFWWKKQLSVILAKNFRCRVVSQRLRVEGLSRILFFGYSSDVELCSKIYEAAVLYLEYRLKRLSQIVPKGHFTVYKNSYLGGFFYGLEQRFAEQGAEEEFALMVRVPSEVTDAFNNKFGKMPTDCVANPVEEVDREAYFRGVEHGHHAKLLPEELLA